MQIRQITANNCIDLDSSSNPQGFTDIDIDEKVYHLSEKQEEKYRVTPFFIEIHPLRHYKISWEYKCSKDCKFYQSIFCYNKDKRLIESFDMLRHGEPVIIKNVCNDNKTIICDGKLNGWNRINSQCCKRIVGFNYNGNDLYETICADDYIKYIGDGNKNDINNGAYCNIDMNNKTIRLSREIPAEIENKIIPNKTVIMNHSANTTQDHIYPFFNTDYSNRIVADNEWHQSQHIIKGNSSIFELTDNKFRKGTKYIKLAVICHKKGDIWFNNLIM
eukprot:947178_1